VTNQETRERRLDEILQRQLGTNILAMIEDPSITDILVNDNGQVWYEARGGLFDGQFSLTSSQVESIIGTAAASLGAVANAEHPIVEGELPIGRIRFEGLLRQSRASPVPPCDCRPACSTRSRTTKRTGSSR
jgi:type IV secretion system protein TrbB